MNSDTEYPAPSEQHNNTDLMVWALYVLDGSARWTDVETLYLKAFQLAPVRLSWRTRADLPDYKKCARALQAVEDPKQSRYIGFFEKRGQHQRRLTRHGLRWCEQHAAQLTLLYGGGLVPSAATQDDGRRLREVLKSKPFNKWSRRRIIESPLWEIAEVFRCLPDSSASVWNARLDEYLSAAKRNTNPDVIEFIEAVRAHVQEKK
jgi:hypothetical protein